ncbi:hypothetical protein [Vibrio splendidus]|uniref:hypothetical protein n=1 Tax=Vibrio splendidus TaxID=29497 RepID=UPI000C837569|nr:hypothetical protein [Vibrio splendidus]PMI78421.1 hypothetical protein BCU38_22405 [Vibrio splendidus]
MNFMDMAGNFMIGLVLPIFCTIAIFVVMVFSKKDKWDKAIIVGTILIILGVAMSGAINLDDAVNGFDQVFVTYYNLASIVVGMVGASLCVLPVLFRKP